MTKVEKFVLGCMANGLFASILNERHPTVQNLAAWGYVERTAEGLAVTERGLAALGVDRSGTRATRATGGGQ